MDTNNEILDAIEILADKKIGDNITKVLTGICTSVNINKNTCVMDSNGVSGTVYFYGSPPEVNGLYRIFVPSNNMSRSFIVVPPKFTVNPNLLDNWYFGNPVNQRGLTSYMGNVYYIDRWRSWDGDSASLSVVSGGIKIAGTLYQYFEPAVLEELFGKTVAISLLFADGTLYTNSFVLKSAEWYTVPINAHGLKLIQFGINNNDFGNINNNFFRIQPVTIGTLSDTILAAKLELGPTQTLAHREGDKWVLNEVPEEGEQLRRCQWYFWRFSPPLYVAGAIAFGIDANTARAIIYLPEQMRTSPTLNLNASSGFFLTGASGDIFDVTVSFAWTNQNSVYVDFKKSGAFEVNAPYFVRGGASSSIDISADL